MALLCAAVFCLFASIGFISNIRGEHATDLLRSSTSALLTGVMGVVYIVLATRKPRYFPIAILSQLAVIKAMPSLLAASGLVWTNPSYREVVSLYASIATILSALAYTLFFYFIQTEGRHAFRSQTELALAHTIQATLVPIIDTVGVGFQIYGVSIPSDKVGGDLVDLVTLPNGSAVAYVADIAGHGLQAGILMGMVKAAARTSLLNLPSPQALFTNLNQVLPKVKEANMYATCAAIYIQPCSGAGCNIEYALAGHPAIYHLAASGNPHPRLADEQLPLGILPHAIYRSQVVHADCGDLLVATTDGVLETAGKDGVEFGTDLFEQLLLDSRDLSLHEIAHRILTAVKTLGPQEDDRTLLLIRIL
ncbi:PP2C family protein-serine/threonine phosphatase [Granulicella arctica]|uniref:PP2C family protein-serine/threonine phosphatase n=1 Tax=Granulicella arctica TaxID=940613 RepID=UPI0021E057C6|nr:PP2C family protein-serine/threonine phosphatase [Granulicella arctica]